MIKHIRTTTLVLGIVSAALLGGCGKKQELGPGSQGLPAPSAVTAGDPAVSQESAPNTAEDVIHSIGSSVATEFLQEFEGLWHDDNAESGVALVVVDGALVMWSPGEPKDLLILHPVDDVDTDNRSIMMRMTPGTVDRNAQCAERLRQYLASERIAKAKEDALIFETFSEESAETWNKWLETAGYGNVLPSKHEAPSYVAAVIARDLSESAANARGAAEKCDPESEESRQTAIVTLRNLDTTGQTVLPAMILDSGKSFGFGFIRKLTEDDKAAVYTAVAAYREDQSNTEVNEVRQAALAEADGLEQSAAKLRPIAATASEWYRSYVERCRAAGKSTIPDYQWSSSYPSAESVFQMCN